jgi:hypothetical protein
MPNLSIPKERVIGVAHEPNVILFMNTDKARFIEYAKQKIGTYYIGDKESLPEPFQEGQLFLTHNRAMSIPQHPMNKTKFCSIILSGKKFMPGHVYRHELVKEILKTDLPIDIYGHGSRLYGNDPRIKGAFPQTYEAVHGTTPYKDYRFTICIENSVSNHYFSEKIINPLMYQTVPIYFGCRNIHHYFHHPIKHLTGRCHDDIKILHEMFTDGTTTCVGLDLKEILKRVNIFDQIDCFQMIFIQVQVCKGSPSSVRYFV